MKLTITITLIFCLTYYLIYLCNSRLSANRIILTTLLLRSKITQQSNQFHTIKEKFNSKIKELIVLPGFIGNIHIVAIVFLAIASSYHLFFIGIIILIVLTDLLSVRFISSVDANLLGIKDSFNTLSGIITVIYTIKNLLLTGSFTYLLIKTYKTL